MTATHDDLSVSMTQQHVGHIRPGRETQQHGELLQTLVAEWVYDSTAYNV